MQIKFQNVGHQQLGTVPLLAVVPKTPMTPSSLLQAVVLFGEPFKFICFRF